MDGNRVSSSEYLKIAVLWLTFLRLSLFLFPFFYFLFFLHVVFRRISPDLAGEPHRKPLPQFSDLSWLSPFGLTYLAG